MEGRGNKKKKMRSRRVKYMPTMKELSKKGTVGVEKRHVTRGKKYHFRRGGGVK
jgi:hypothetical protein